MFRGPIATERDWWATTMNWTGAQAGEGVEYHPLALVTSTAVMVRGSGVWSLDRGVSPPRPADAARLAEASTLMTARATVTR
jgi:hypothetical protein